MNPIQVLLRHSVDYAGLFPPAGLSMAAAVANYAEYQAGREVWALGRFILPVSRLAEFEEAVQLVEPKRWNLSVLVGPDMLGDLERIAAFNARHANSGAGAVIDIIETKAGSAKAIHETMRPKPADLQAYFELPIDHDPGELVSVIGRTDGHAKVRTGGVTPDAFPALSDLARFIHTCVRAKVSFKATAGLHHALRGEYPLTYEPGGARGVMFGFLNLFLATAFIRNGMDQQTAARVLEEASPASIRMDERGIAWRDQRLDLKSLSRARATIVSFGSCSFTEPLGELQALHWLEPRVQV